jgi:hypothetical protein
MPDNSYISEIKQIIRPLAVCREEIYILLAIASGVIANVRQKTYQAINYAQTSAYRFTGRRLRGRNNGHR